LPKTHIVKRGGNIIIQRESGEEWEARVSHDEE